MPKLRFQHLSNLWRERESATYEIEFTELLKIFYRVAKTLTPEEISSLKENVPAIWEKFTHLEGPDGSFSAWEIHHLDSFPLFSHF